jgi:hypothetical protein
VLTTVLPLDRDGGRGDSTVLINAHRHTVLFNHCIQFGCTGFDVREVLLLRQDLSRRVYEDGIISPDLLQCGDMRFMNAVS